MGPGTTLTGGRSTTRVMNESQPCTYWNPSERKKALQESPMGFSWGERAGNRNGSNTVSLVEDVEPTVETLKNTPKADVDTFNEGPVVPGKHKVI